MRRVETNDRLLTDWRIMRQQENGQTSHDRTRVPFSRRKWYIMSIQDQYEQENKKRERVTRVQSDTSFFERRCAGISTQFHALRNRTHDEDFRIKWIQVERHIQRYQKLRVTMQGLCDKQERIVPEQGRTRTFGNPHKMLRNIKF